MKNLPELDIKQYIKLAIEGIHKMVDDNNMGIPLEEYTDFLKSTEGSMFNAGYMIGIGYHPDSLEDLKKPLESLVLEELEALVEEEIQ
tara:strand:- start:6821 stop:7084 length:264 start_codon:yes stop_codon:yes gene_type:complete